MCEFLRERVEVLGLGSLYHSYLIYNSYVLSTEECWVRVPLTVDFDPSEGRELPHLFLGK